MQIKKYYPLCSIYSLPSNHFNKMYETITDNTNDQFSHILNLGKTFIKFTYYSPLSIAKKINLIVCMKGHCGSIWASQCVCWWGNVKGGGGGDWGRGWGSGNTHKNDRWRKSKKIRWDEYYQVYKTSREQKYICLYARWSVRTFVLLEGFALEWSCLWRDFPCDIYGAMRLFFFTSKYLSYLTLTYLWRYLWLMTNAMLLMRRKRREK